MQMLNVLLNLVLNSVLINLSLWKLIDRLFFYGLKFLGNVRISGGKESARSWLGLEGS